MTPTEAKKRYADRAKAFRRIRKDTGIPLRKLAKEIDIDHCVIHRFEHQRPILAVHFIQLENWVLNKRLLKIVKYFQPRPAAQNSSIIQKPGD